MKASPTHASGGESDTSVERANSFFFEKKTQKTFGCLDCGLAGEGLANGQR
jgi:hypothetical protein